MIIRKLEPKDIAAVREIAELLHPKWFDSKALSNIPKDVLLSRCLVAVKDNRVAGFISFYSQNGKGRIGWLGVHPSFHRQGIGKYLLIEMERILKEIGITTLGVETVVEQEPKDGSYDQTMEFYRACGFSINKLGREKRYKQFRYKMGVLIKKLKI